MLRVPTPSSTLLPSSRQNQAPRTPLRRSSSNADCPPLGPHLAMPARRPLCAFPYHQLATSAGLAPTLNRSVLLNLVDPLDPVLARHCPARTGSNSRWPTNCWPLASGHSKLDATLTPPITLRRSTVTSDPLLSERPTEPAGINKHSRPPAHHRACRCRRLLFAGKLAGGQTRACWPPSYGLAHCDHCLWAALGPQNKHCLRTD